MAKKAPPPYETFIKEQRKKGISRERNFDHVDPSHLNTDQLKVYNFVEANLKENRAPLRLILLGEGGVGKSYVALCVKLLMEKHKKKCMFMSFTGSSAYIIGGRTFHSSLLMGYSYKKKHPAKDTKALAKLISNVSYLIFDELSLIGLSLFGFINERIKGACQSQDIFANKSVILMGDLSQIPPVMDKSIYSAPDPNNQLEVSGAQAYASFNKVVCLKQQMRQLGEKENIFRGILGRMRRGQITETDVQILSTRNSEILSDEELNSFEEATFIFSERKSCHRFNLFRLEKSGNEIVEIKSRYAKTNQECEHSIKLAKGCRIMFNKNLWIEGSLFNGMTGTLIDFATEKDSFGNPVCLYIRPDVYLGEWYQPPIRMRQIPIVQQKIPIYDKEAKLTFTRINFPVELAYAVTAHKVQGLTLDKVVIAFPPPPSRNSLWFRHCPQMLYCTASRVRSLDSIVFSNNFRADLINHSRGNHVINWQREEQRLLAIEQGIPPPASNRTGAGVPAPQRRANDQLIDSE